MVLGFKKQFVDNILSSKKIHTIRADKNDRWMSGRQIHFATGVRTKNYNQFMHGVCHAVQRIKILRTHDKFQISVDGNSLPLFEVENMAINDGFDSVQEFLYFFVPKKEIDKKQDKQLIWEGKIIHWTEKRY